MKGMVEVTRSIRTLGLDLSLSLYTRYIISRSKRQVETQSVIDAMTHSEFDAAVSMRGERILFLRKRLRKVPYWTRGHLELGKVSLSQKDFSLAYSSSLAVQKLEPSGELWAEAVLLQAKSHLQSGDAHSALSCLMKLKGKRSKVELDVLEEFGATYIALDDPKNASEVLNAIPQDKRTMTCVAALEYLSRKEEHNPLQG